MALKLLQMFKETILTEITGLAADVGGGFGSLTNYDTGDIKGLLDNVDSEKVRKLVEKVRPLIPEYIEKVRKIAMDTFEQGKKEFDKIRAEVEGEVRCLVLVT